MKKFLLLSSIFALPLYGVIAYYCCFFPHEKVMGEMGITAEIPFGKEYSLLMSQHNLQGNRTVPYTKAKGRCRIFSFGDSFCNGGIVGFQNYVGHLLADSVLNIQGGTYVPGQKAAGLLQSGFFDTDTPKLVIVESVERYLIEYLCNIDFNKSISGEELVVKEPQQATQQKSGVTLDRIFRWVTNRTGLRTPIRKIDLNINAFSHNEMGRELYFYQRDLWFDIPANRIERAKTNLISLRNKFAERGIPFIFIIAADKYDVYRKFAVNNPYPENHLLDYFSDLSDENWFINTKELLQSKVQEGYKDVYRIDDTHWSYLGHQMVAEEVVRRYRASGK
jgi:lysophospholipase L1-like esterase